MELVEIKKLIPWYVAGTLNEDERKIVEESLEHSIELQEELQFWRRVHGSMNLFTHQSAKKHLSPEQIIDYIEKKITDVALAAQIDKHLANCEDCRQDGEIVRGIHLSKRAHKFQDVQPSYPSEIRTIPNFNRLPKPKRYRYGVHAAIGLIIALTVILFSIFSPSGQETVTSTIVYNESNPSSSGSGLTVIFIDPDTREVNLMVEIPHSPGSARQYGITLVKPSHDQVQIAGLYMPTPYNSSYDILRIVINRYFLEREGEYSLVASETLPTALTEIGPKQYPCSFILKIKNE
ncbi:MAG: hypothetical protein ACHQQQ_09450 [Bacteroidota bacterium]